MNKALIGLHDQLYYVIAFLLLRRMPFYAYLHACGTKDYLLIISISDHYRRVRDQCILHHKDPDPHGFVGGLQISLDLEKDFDIVGRAHVTRTLQVLDISPDLRDLIFHGCSHTTIACHTKNSAAGSGPIGAANRVPKTPTCCGFYAFVFSFPIFYLYIPLIGLGNILLFLLMISIFDG